MSELNEENLRLRLKLYESALPSATVRWSEKDQWVVEECHGNVVVPTGTYAIDSLLDEKNVDFIKEYRDSVHQEPTNINFTICFKGDKIDVHCSSIRLKKEIISLWILVPEKDHSIFYLQNAAHDFRSPLGAIIGVVNLLQHSIKSEDELDKEEVITLLDMIKVNSDKGLRLADEIMELAEMESDGYKLKTDKVVMSDFVENYLATHRLLTLRKRIQVKFDCESTASAFINESKLTRALDNILSNSVKFSKAGSTITFKLDDHSTQIELTISDQGIGMSPDVLRNVFVRFGKAKRNGLEGEPSHGLGMSIVRQIMKLHEGDLKIASEENKGTQVSLILKKAK
ncbi:sensor histidine kinase [Ekhidna sp.]|uniref:sensor histidine kinase n=1 Tax=Ekhidna sp. TaxID=2608089 RepID=UPI003B50C576